MSFATAIATCFSKFVTFGGRASRSEYWKFYLFCVIWFVLALILDVSLGTTIVEDGEFQGGAAFWVTFLVLLLPLSAVSVRRLHDTERSGWWFWIQLVPFVGGIIFLVFTCTRGTEGDNDYGPDPFGPDVEAVFG